MSKKHQSWNKKVQRALRVHKAGLPVIKKVKNKKKQYRSKPLTAIEAQEQKETQPWLFLDK